MAAITFKGAPVHTSGSLPAIGTKAPDFLLARADLTDVGLDAFSGKKKILNIVPSLDTPVCALSAQAGGTPAMLWTPDDEAGNR